MISYYDARVKGSKSRSCSHDNALILESVKYEKFYHVSHAVYGQSVKNSGMAHVTGDYPLYYDAINEKGLGMAGLNFVGKCQPVFPYSRFSWISSGDAVKLLMESMRSHCILPAVM